METAIAVEDGDPYAELEYNYIYGDNATGGFIVNFTEMVEICPDMTDGDRALLQGQSRVPSAVVATGA